MTKPFLRRNLLAKTPLLAGAAAKLTNDIAAASAGVRINHLSYFKGAAMRARFAPRALAPSEFMKMPASLASTP